VDALGLLARDIEEIITVARWYGLDFFDVRFEICPPEVLHSFGACKMPLRFTHWSFGKAIQRMQMEYDYGLSRLHEMVINTDPCYAFLLRDNTRLQNRLVVAHAVAHSDFFKNNVYFSRVSRSMLEIMAVASRRIRDYERFYGRERVESFLDAVLAVQEHINPFGYQPAWKHAGSGLNRTRSRAELPEKDLLGFILDRGRGLKDWQRDIIRMVREESLYFWPQLATKICNEGWATYWHLKIGRVLDLNENDSLEFARMHAELIRPSPMAVNPYLLGLSIFTDIARRFGESTVFEVRATCDDVSFLRNYLTEELVRDLGLYAFRRMGYEWRVCDTDWRAVRDTLVQQRFNCGHPYLMVEDGDFNRQGELYLKHYYEGQELDVFYLERTLPLVYRLWGGPVHLETVLDDKPVLFSFHGNKIGKRFL